MFIRTGFEQIYRCPYASCEYCIACGLFFHQLASVSMLHDDAAAAPSPLPSLAIVVASVATFAEADTRGVRLLCNLKTAVLQQHTDESKCRQTHPKLASTSLLRYQTS